MIRSVSRAASTLLLAGLLAGGAATAAVAQTHEPTAERMFRQRLAIMHDRLNITRGQEPAWDRFARMSMQVAVKLDQENSEQAARLRTMDAVQTLQLFADKQTDQAKQLQSLVPSLSELYSQLAPRQRQIADQMFRSYAERVETRPQISAR